MKRLSLLMLMLLSLALSVTARPVDVKNAREVGAKFLTASTSMKTVTPNDLSLVTAYSTEAGAPAFYVFNTDDGFVIVAADDCAVPILGYSDKGVFNPENHPVQMEDYLQHFVKQIQYGIENGVEADEETARQWFLVNSTGRINEEKTVTAVTPLLSAQWGQGCNYNNYCPTDSQGPCGRTLVGCVAVAMGQIMHFWGYPAHGSGSHTYTPLNQNDFTPSGYPNQTANFGATTYQWAYMPNSLDDSPSNTQIQAVATLLWHCGVSVDMMYGVSGSGAYSEDVPYALVNYFTYASDMEAIGRWNYTANGWFNQIKASLDIGRPVYYSGSDTEGLGGHAFVCDGYNTSNMLHFNWGWYGNHDNYFAVDALNVSNYQFNNNNYAIINIHPNSTGTTCQITATASPEQAGEVTGWGTYNYGSVCVLNAIPSFGHSFINWTKNGSVVSTNPSYSFTVTEDANYVAHFTSTSSNQVVASYYPDENDPQSPFVKVSWALGQSPNVGNFYDFEDGTMQGWTTIDADGDGSTWMLGSVAMGSGYGHNGSADLVLSKSYDNNDGPLNPDNYLVSPQLTLGGQFSFYACAQDAAWAAEHFGVAVSTTTATASAFTTIQEWTMTAKGAGVPTDVTRDGSRTQGNWYQYTVDLSNYAGQTGYVAIRHFNCTDYFYLDVDDIEYGYAKNNREVLFTDNFEDGSLVNWMLIDADGDGSTWQNATPEAYGIGTAHSGTNCASSWSWNSYSMNPDNYMISPEVAGADNISYYVATNTGYPDHYGVFASSTGTNISDFVLVFEETCPASKGGSNGAKVSTTNPNGTREMGAWVSRSIDLPFGTKYVAFRHYNSYDMNYLFIDDVTITSNGVDPESYVSYNIYRRVADKADLENDLMVQAYGSQSSKSDPVMIASGMEQSPYIDQSWSDLASGSYQYGVSGITDTGNESGIVWSNSISKGSYYTITASVIPAGSGTVTGTGYYVYGSVCTLVASANSGYHFVHWTKNGTVVSTNTSYSFTVTENAEYVANFEEISGEVLIYEPFEEYAVGNKIALSAQAAGHNWWTTWNNSPGSTEDGVVALYDNHKCGHLVYSNDQVLLLDNYTSGTVTASFDMYIPNGKDAYNNMLHIFNGSGSQWATEVYYKSSTNGTSIQAGGTTTNFTCPYDQWFNVSYIVDLDNDVATFFIDNNVVVTWQFSLQASGSAGIRQLAAFNFYPPTSASVSDYYIDNIVVMRSFAGAPQLSFTPNNVDVSLEDNDVTSVDINIINTGNSIGEWSGYIDFGQGGTGSQTAALSYHSGGEGNNIGSSSACTREMAARFPVSAYASSSMGMKIVSAQYYINSGYQSANQNYIFRIYGQGMYNQPGTLLAESTVHSSASGQWITATFNNAVYMTGQDIWATVQVEQAANEYPLSMDGGEYGEIQDGNWLSTNGGSFNHCYSSGSFGGAWLITLNCQGDLVPATWAVMNQTSGSVYGNSSQTVTLYLNSIGLESGTYYANFVANTNDVTAPTVNIPITLSVDVVDGNIGYTTYDWQSNSGPRTWTHVWPDGKVNFAYTTASNTSFSDRGTGIGTYDAANGMWIPSSGRVENERTGFGSIAQYGSNGLVIASHTATECKIYIAPNKDNLVANSLTAVSALDNTFDPCWPAVMTSGANRDIIHVIATGNSNNTMYYFRSIDGGQTWDKQNEILPYMGPDYCTDWNSNSCYWMETTEDNCLALVVNNAWSDGMVIYSYDDGATWQRKVFYKHPNPAGDFTDFMFFYPRWTSCQWDSQHRLHVLYEFNATTGEVGSGSYYPNLGGVAYWNEIMAYNTSGNTASAIPGNLVPGQHFVMDSAYLNHDIYSSWWLWSDASHDMWPEYIGYLAPLTDDGYPEDPYSATEFNLIDGDERAKHGHYNQGVCGFPVLCMVPGTDEMVALWSAMDENHTDIHGNYYYKLFASYSANGGITWSPMVHLTNTPASYQVEHIYNQAVVVGRTLVVATQTDLETGSYVQSDDSDPYDNQYVGLTFDIDELFDTTSVPHYAISASVTPSGSGVVTGAGSYFQGSTCTLQATPNTGYSFLNWTKNGAVVSSNPSYTFIVTGNANYVAHFTPISYTVAVSSEPIQGGLVGGGGEYSYGATATVTAAANDGYTFINWTRNGVQVSSNPQYSFIVTESVNLVAHFTLGGYVVTVSAEPAEGGIVGGSGGYEYGETATVTAVANDGYSFVNWTRNGVQVSVDPTYSFMVTESVNLVAHFTLVSYTITVSADPVEGGTVEGTGTYEHGTAITLTATANTGYIFNNWTKDGVLVSTNASYGITVTEDAAYVAHFSLVSYNVTVSADPAEGGIVQGAGTYTFGTLITLEAVANTGYIFENWTKDGVVVSTSTSFNLNVTENASYVAHFALQTVYYQITVSASPVEGGMVSGGGTFAQGSVCTVSATANAGYIFENWTKNGNVVSTNTSFSFNVTENASYVAHFSQIYYTVTAVTDPVEGGVVNGAGTYPYGSTVTMSVTLNPNYIFVNWTENGAEVSTEELYTFALTGPRNLVANLMFVDDVDEYSYGSFQVFPNPSFEGGEVFITGLGDVRTTVELYDVLGAMVMRKEVVDGKITLDSSLKSGVYLLKAVSESGRVSCSKLIVQSQR